MKRLLVICLVAATSWLASCGDAEVTETTNEAMEAVEELTEETPAEEPAAEEAPAAEASDMVAVEGAILISDLFAEIVADGDYSGPAAEKYRAMETVSIQGTVQKVKEGKITIATGEHPNIHKATAFLENNDDVSMLQESGMFNTDPGTTVVLTGRVTTFGKAGDAYNMSIDKATFQVVE